MSRQSTVQFLLLGLAQLGLVGLGNDTLPDSFDKVNAIVYRQRRNLSQSCGNIHIGFPYAIPIKTEHNYYTTCSACFQPIPHRYSVGGLPQMYCRQPSMCSLLRLFSRMISVAIW